MPAPDPRQTQLDADKLCDVIDVDGSLEVTEDGASMSPAAFNHVLSLIERIQELEAACGAFVEWLDSDSRGPQYPEGVTRNTSEGERIWREWWDGQTDLCARSVELARAALVPVAEGGA